MSSPPPPDDAGPLLLPPGYDGGSAGAEPATSDAGPGSDAGASEPERGPPPACAIDLEPELVRLGVPGLSAALLSDGRLRCTAVAGHADLAADRRVTPDVPFGWASVSKTVTATAAMILYEEGRFALDDDVNAYLPFRVSHPRCEDRPITFRQLMTHTSSIRDDDSIYDNSYTTGDSSVPLGEFLREYLDARGDLYDDDHSYARSCPGESNRYSNIGIGLLGLLVEQIAGVPFDAFCRARIFEPLGMSEASFRLADMDQARLARPYERRDGEHRPLAHYGFPTYPDGSLRASAPSLARFLAMMAGGGAYGGTRILAAETVAEMALPQVPGLDPLQGLVWFYDFDGLLGHDGGDDGASSLMFFDPDTGAGALLVANGDWEDQDAEAMTLFARLIAEARDR